MSLESILGHEFYKKIRVMAVAKSNHHKSRKTNVYTVNQKQKYELSYQTDSSSSKPRGLKDMKVLVYDVL